MSPINIDKVIIMLRVSTVTNQHICVAASQTYYVWEAVYY